MGLQDLKIRLRHPLCNTRYEAARYEQFYMNRYGVTREKARADIAAAHAANLAYLAEKQRRGTDESFAEEFHFPSERKTPTGSPAAAEPAPEAVAETSEQPAGGSPVPAQKARAVAYFRVEEHFDHKEVTFAEGHKAAPASRRMADETPIIWGDRFSYEAAFPELPGVTTTVIPGEILRVAYERTTYDGEDIKYVDLIVHFGSEAPAMPEAFDAPERREAFEKRFNRRMMRLTKGVGTPDSKGCDVSFAGEAENAKAFYAFKLTLNDGRIVYESPRENGVRVPCEAVLRPERS